MHSPFDSYAVVVPTCRPHNFLNFLDAWKSIFKKEDVFLVVVEDAPKCTEQITKAIKETGLYFKHINQNQAKELLNNVPIGSDMIRSAGILLADEEGRQYTVSLDDDVAPSDEGFFDQYSKVFNEGAIYSPYFSVGALTNSGYQMRGMPISHKTAKEVAVQYGGWHTNLDLDALDQFHFNQKQQDTYYFFLPRSFPVPVGSPTTCCAMNMVWNRDYTPIMWQLSLYKDRYNRFGDIWSGLFIKKTLDLAGAVMVINGLATVEHTRASDPYKSLAHEIKAYHLNEEIWEIINNVKIDPSMEYSLINLYRLVTTPFIDYMTKKDPEYADYFLTAREEWLGKFSENE